MNLNKNCPFSAKPCNTDCAMLIVLAYENHRTQKYDYEYRCGLISHGNVTRHTKGMEVVE